MSILKNPRCLSPFHGSSSGPLASARRLAVIKSKASQRSCGRSADKVGSSPSLSEFLTLGFRDVTGCKDAFRQTCVFWRGRPVVLDSVGRSLFWGPTNGSKFTELPIYSLPTTTNPALTSELRGEL